MIISQKKLSQFSTSNPFAAYRGDVRGLVLASFADDDSTDDGSDAASTSTTTTSATAPTTSSDGNAIVPGATVATWDDPNVQAAFSALITEMNNQKASVQSLNTKLYALLGQASIVSRLIGVQSSYAALVDAWHTSALAWMNLATTTVATIQSEVQGYGYITDTAQSSIENWTASGVVVLRNGMNIANMINNPDFTSSFQAVTDAFQPAMNNVWTDFIDAVAKIVNDIFNKLAKPLLDDSASELVKLLLILGGASALVIFILVKSGVKLDLPFVSVGK